MLFIILLLSVYAPHPPEPVTQLGNFFMVTILLALLQSLVSLQEGGNSYNLCFLTFIHPNLLATFLCFLSHQCDIIHI